MVKPNESQSILLEDLRFLVIEIMSDMEIWQDFDLLPLQKIRLGLLRKNATQRHGVTKWNRGITCLLYTSPSPRDLSTSRMPSSA